MHFEAHLYHELSGSLLGGGGAVTRCAFKVWWDEVLRWPGMGCCGLSGGASAWLSSMFGEYFLQESTREDRSV